MLQYTAKDIVEKALALADLQNSDFITYKEKIAYLNDAYVSMFNKAIDYGDNIFTTEIEIENGEIELPIDFYQLREVYIRNGKDKTIVTPKPINQSYGSLSYEIINDTLYLYGKYNGKAYISYYYNPSTLFIDSESFVPNYIIKDNEYLVCAYKDYYLTLNASSTKLYLRSIKDSSFELYCDITEECVYNIQNNKAKFMNGRYFVSLEENIDNVVTGSFIYDFLENDYILVDDSNKRIVIVNDELFLLDTNTNNYYAINDNVNVKGKIKEGDTPKCQVCYYIDNTDIYASLQLGIVFDKIIYSLGNNENIYYDVSENEKVTFYFGENDLQEYTLMFALANKNVIYKVSSEYDLPLIYDRFRNEKFLSFLGYDLDSGYGYLVKEIGNRYVIKSCFTSTELNFPNNTYFTLIAYFLAITFCNKQNKDTTRLYVELEKQENIFYDSLHRDETAFRITNVDNYSLY